MYIASQNNKKNHFTLFLLNITYWNAYHSHPEVCLFLLIFRFGIFLKRNEMRSFLWLAR